MAASKYIPDFVGTVTKYVFIESPSITPQHLSIRAYEISRGVMIKETCFGLQITGMPDEVEKIVEELRREDPYHILIKDRGFPPGSVRRCRANLGGARPGYFGHENEMRMLRYISYGLEKYDEGQKPSEEAQSAVKAHEDKVLTPAELEKIIKSGNGSE